MITVPFPQPLLQTRITMATEKEKDKEIMHLKRTIGFLKYQHQEQMDEFKRRYRCDIEHRIDNVIHYLDRNEPNVTAALELTKEIKRITK